MKRLITFIAAITLGVPAQLVFPTAAQASNSSRYVPVYCKTEIVPIYSEVNVGECLSVEETSYQYFIRDSDGWATHWCELLRDVYPDDYDALFDSSWTGCVQYAHGAIGN